MAMMSLDETGVETALGKRSISGDGGWTTSLPSECVGDLIVSLSLSVILAPDRRK